MAPARRRLLVAGLAGAALAAAPRWAFAGPPISLPSEAANRRFSIFYDGYRIGAHTISNTPENGETRVSTEIDLLVKALVFTLYEFRHRSQEIWRDGRLLSLQSETKEHGKSVSVAGAAVAQGFRVVGESGPFLASADALTSNSLWTPAVLEQRTVIDAQHGGVIGVRVRKLADETLTIAGGQIRATRHRFISPYLAGSIWYDERGHWVKGEFERDGARVEYRLDA